MNTRAYQERLLKEKADLIAVHEQAAEASRPVELDQASVGRLSRMDAMQMQQMAMETARRREAALQRIEGALRRIESGQFGRCFVCGAAIEAARLDLDPTITRCVECVEE